MVKSSIVYKGDLCCELTHGPSGITIQTDAPKDNHGLGRYFSPTDLVTAAMASCIATIMGIKAQEWNLDISGMEINTQKIMSQDLPRRIVKVILDIKMPCNPEEKQKNILQKVPDSCPVTKSLHPDIELVFNYTWPN